MMFYRKDILKELGIEIPKTWDEMKVVISELSKNQMTLGMLPSELTFDSILYQNNGALYNNDFTASALNSENAINAFKQYCEFYTDYKLDRATSVEQRFRTGESPIIIADYTTYNVLEVSAPDIKGLWGFTTLPGIQNEDGTINNTTASTGLACMMMKKTKDKNSSWEFIKWWLSEEIQTQYGKEMEGLMGEAARYPTANVKAFANLPWPTDDYEALEEQFKNVKGIPQVPGSYYTWRNVNNAFYSVVVAEDDKLMQPREALNEYLEYIDAEITNKRQEFGMTTAEDEK
jgi:ABC-type glycerol-3-phosphate transport system substrate-binding protein